MTGRRAFCAALTWFAVVAGPAAPSAAEILMPPFFSGERDLLERVDDGQFGTLLEVHLLQYAADPRWRADWARDRYTDSGFLMQYGSTSGTRLYVDGEIALNLPLTDRLGVGYERREWEDGRFELFDERLHAHWFVTERWALVAAGWPAHRKSEASFGLGAQLGSGPGGWLRVVVLDEAFVHKRKGSGETSFSKSPIRYLADGYLERGRVAFYGSANLGEPYRSERRPGAEGESAFRGEGFSAYGTLGAELRGREWGAGLLGRIVVDRLKQNEIPPEGESEVLETESAWSLLQAHVWQRWGLWTGSMLLAYGRQRDAYEAPGEEGTYRMEQGLYGLELGYAGWDPLEVRAGYLGSYSRMVRRADPADEAAPPVLGDRRREGYVDKVHLKALYRFRPRVALEALISKEVTRGAFGGFAVKALAVF